MTFRSVLRSSAFASTLVVLPFALVVGCSGAADPSVNDGVPAVSGDSTSSSSNGGASNGSSTFGNTDTNSATGTGTSAGDTDAGTSPSGSGASTGSGGSTGTTGTSGGSSSTAGADASTGGSTFGQTAVARATEWITAKMPYCGGPNGGSDVICGGTCERSGAADTKEWNPYRSDCSGLVSYAWALPAPGHTTGDFAPYDTSDSHEINGTDLEPGDALNNDEHVMLFAGWVDKSKGEATIIEESTCGKDALTTTKTFTVTDASRMPLDDGTGRVFYAIRYGK